MSKKYFFIFVLALIYISSCAVRDLNKLTNESKSLNLSRQGLSEIPVTVFENKQLKVLKLFGNHLTEISSRIGELTELEELYIGNNDLTSLPPEIGKLGLKLF